MKTIEVKKEKKDGAGGGKVQESSIEDVELIKSCKVELKYVSEGQGRGIEGIGTYNNKDGRETNGNGR